MHRAYVRNANLELVTIGAWRKRQIAGNVAPALPCSKPAIHKPFTFQILSRQNTNSLLQQNLSCGTEIACRRFLREQKPIEHFAAMPRRFDHIDLRVSSLEAVRPFYQMLLPALGFTRDAKIEGWFQLEVPDSSAAEFFGVTESPGHIPNENRIAFRADSMAEVDRLYEVVVRAGGRNIEGPEFETPYYYAIFFDDPCGNRFEICYRTSPQ